MKTFFKKTPNVHKHIQQNPYYTPKTQAVFTQNQSLEKSLFRMETKKDFENRFKSNLFLEDFIASFES